VQLRPARLPTPVYLPGTDFVEDAAMIQAIIKQSIISFKA
jgi:hypothetical protein